MAIENETVNRGYELPHPGNAPAHDVQRLIDAITAIDADVGALIAALAAKAGIESPAFSGSPTAPTQPSGSNNNTLATTGHVKSAISAFFDTAEGAIETITELQAALSGAGVVEDLLTQIGQKAPLASPALTGTPTAPTPTVETNTDQVATAAFVQLVRAAIIAGAPTNLNTLAKLAAAIGDDPNFAVTVASDLGNKAPLADPAFTGNPTVPTQPEGNNSTRAANTAFVKRAIDTALQAVSTAMSSLASSLVPKSRKITAGAGLGGGGALDADRTVSLGAAKPISNSTTGTVGSDGHDHALGFVAAEVYTGSAQDNLVFPLGHPILVFVGSNVPRNGQITPCLNKNDTSAYVVSGNANAGAALSGVWRSRGGIVDNSNDFYQIVRVQ